jgi:hypothetical protein
VHLLTIYIYLPIIFTYHIYLIEMEWDTITAHRAFPQLSLADFDLSAHRARVVPSSWQPETFPFDYKSLPKLPPINNSRYKLLSRTHRSLADRRFNTEDPTADPEKESYNFLETMGDAALRWYCTRAAADSGCAVGEDLHVSFVCERCGR